MSLLGNILWLIFGGLIAGLGYIVGGLLLCLTVVGIPFGLQSIKLGVATFAPFGKRLVELDDANSVLKILFTCGSCSSAGRSPSPTCSTPRCWRSPSSASRSPCSTSS